MSYQTSDRSNPSASRQPGRSGGFIEQLISNARARIRRQDPPGKALRTQGLPVTPCRRLVTAHNLNHPRNEQLRSLRSKLLMKTAACRGGVLFALLSPCAREGRSQLAAELALSFAQLGRTLLVDADMRRPSQHELFQGAVNSAGLVQALEDGCPASLQPVLGFPKMAVLTAGGQPANPAELLHGQRFRRMTAEWRRSFEYVVFDTPPISEFADAITIAGAAGNLLVLSRAQLTTFSALKEMQRHLQPLHARVVGAIINDF